MSLGCAVLFCSIGYFLIRRFLGALDPKSVLLAGYLLIPVDRREFFTMKKRRVLPFDLHLGRARTDQGRQHTHHIPQLIVSWRNFSPHALLR